ncbi:hypothetical protein BT69DRAFT_937545 [Atractiella rhizophila]|nr:hypothetical protein BT69DRAFT_937545 [Atractiella rhizophila]
MAEEKVGAVEDEETMPDYASWTLEEVVAQLDGWGFKTSRNRKVVAQLDGWGFKTSRNRKAMVHQLEGIWSRIQEQKKKAKEKAARKRRQEGQNPEAAVHHQRVVQSVSSEESEKFDFSDDVEDGRDMLKNTKSKSIAQAHGPKFHKINSKEPAQVPKTKKGKGSRSLDEEESLLRSAIMSNKALYEQILRYEPLDFAIFVELAAEEGLKLTRPRIRNFLDKRCITFYTTESLKKGRARHP